MARKVRWFARPVGVTVWTIFKNGVPIYCLLHSAAISEASEGQAVASHDSRAPHGVNSQCRLRVSDLARCGGR